MNKLLEKQIKVSLKSENCMTPELRRLMEMVSDSYDQYERDRHLIEQTMEANSEGLRENYEKLQRQEALKQSNEKLQHFVAIASHDLKAPLRTVGAFTQLLQRNVKDHLDDSGREYLKFILEGVDRMNALIEGLICYSKIDTQNESPSPQDCNIILEKVRHNLLAELEESQGSVKVKRTLPQIIGLEFQLIQLFQNLISNGLKFRKEEQPEIVVDWEERESEICFSVSDNGIGISTENQEKVFEVFQRLHSANDFDGSGLGLSICKKAVERLEGKIWLESEPGRGTTFLFTVPKSKAIMPEPA